MARRSRPKAIGTRYDQREIAIQIQKSMKANEREPKAAYDLLGIGKGEWSRKERGLVPFTLWEVSKLADWLEEGPGWPFISKALADQLRPLTAGRK